MTSDQMPGCRPYFTPHDKRERDERDIAQVVSKSPPEWTVVDVPNGLAASSDASTWYRCAVRLPRSWKDDKSLELLCPTGPQYEAWLNGVLADSNVNSTGDHVTLRLPPAAVIADEANLLVVRVAGGGTGADAKGSAPSLRSGTKSVSLAGRWQMRTGDDPKWQNIPLPAKFGAPPDIYFEAPVEPVSP